MEFSARAVGTSFDQIVNDLSRSYRTANRTAGRDVARVGKAAIAKGAPRMMGRKLTSKTRAKVGPDHVEVMFTPFSVGGWAMMEFGAKPHDIYPRARVGRGGRRPALKFSGLYSNNAAHPGFAGRGLWTRATERLVEAVDKVIEESYGEALTG